MFNTKQTKLEKEIKELKKKFLKERNRVFIKQCKENKTFNLSDINLAVDIITSDIKYQIEALELERKFIMEKQNNLFWRIIWNVLVPILVSLVTVYLSINFK